MLAERPLSRADLIAVSDLFARYETAFLGSVETSPAEVEEYIHFVKDLDHNSVGVVRDGRLVAFAAVETSNEGALMVDPADPEVVEVNSRLLEWLARQSVGRVNIFSGDRAALEAARALGWGPSHSAYDMHRDIGEIEAPSWPEGVTVGGLDPERDAAAVYDLIYERSGWGDVPGHHERPLDEWRTWLTLPSVKPDLQVVARAGGSPVGVARCTVFSDGMGFVMQLAVDRDHRRQGLGRALLLESFARLRDAGATKLGLGVMASNRTALALYEGVGMHVAREYIGFSPPDRVPGPSRTA
jgi:GNAT superfamily N-acetyltransferase